MSVSFRRRWGATVIAVLALSGMASPAAAEYPDHPITMIVPYAAGGSSDIVGRILGEHLGNALNQRIIIENVGGSGGALGTQRAVGAEPDGYTLLLGANSELLINKALQPHLAYDATQDLTPIGLVATGAIVILGKRDLDAASWSKLVELSASGQTINYGTSGHGTIQHLGGEIARVRTDIDMEHVPFQGAGPMVVDLLGGHIDVGIATLAAARPLIEDGTVQAYAVLSQERTEFAEDIPAAGELDGLADVHLETWYGVFAPAGLPEPVAAKLEEALLSIMDDPALREKFAAQAISLSSMPAQEFKDFVAEEAETYKAIIAEAGITMQ